MTNKDKRDIRIMWIIAWLFWILCILLFCTLVNSYIRSVWDEDMKARTDSVIINNNLKSNTMKKTEHIAEIVTEGGWKVHSYQGTQLKVVELTQLVDRNFKTIEEAEKFIDEQSWEILENFMVYIAEKIRVRQTQIVNEINIKNKLL